jgi:RNA polymerase-associated protein CTR9
VSREDRLKLESEGVAYVQRAFKLNNKSSAAAIALASVSGQGGQIPVASKLAEGDSVFGQQAAYNPRQR